MAEVIKLIVDVSVQREDKSFFDIGGWIVKGYNFNEENCLYICENELHFTKQLAEPIGEYYKVGENYNLGKIPDDLEDEEEFINNMALKLNEPIFKWINSPAIDKQLRDTDNLYLTEDVKGK
ncbi:hypothetical protein NQZ71_13270 [Niallia taxi]|mgnify:CR=1 FL=1|uniref:hypothetical protein n=1 Tax=Niallia taxi TaxID=2499688 RepID=UPI002934D454|nr:hypothetical protein [Niallia taxi]WOD61786.1 hypothetical protein NQZ71_13270 [Niallia taxi]